MEPGDEGRSRRGRGKPRDENLRNTIVQAAAEVLLEKGYRRFTMEGVAARAQASKVTIYKWWSSKGTLALDGYVHCITDSIAFPQSESPRDDVVRQLTAVIEGLTSTPMGRAITELIGAAQEDPDLKRELSIRYIQPRRDLAAQAFARLLGGDPVDRREELHAVTDQVYGAIYQRLLFALAPLDGNFARQLVDFWVPRFTPASDLASKPDKTLRGPSPLGTGRVRRVGMPLRWQEKLEGDRGGADPGSHRGRLPVLGSRTRSHRWDEGLPRPGDGHVGQVPEWNRTPAAHDATFAR